MIPSRRSRHTETKRQTHTTQIQHHHHNNNASLKPRMQLIVCISINDDAVVDHTTALSFMYDGCCGNNAQFRPWRTMSMFIIIIIIIMKHQRFSARVRATREYCWEYSEIQAQDNVGKEQKVMTS